MASSRRIQTRDTFGYLLRHGSETTLEIERWACLPSWTWEAGMRDSQAVARTLIALESA